MTVSPFQQNLPSPPLFATTGRGMQFSFSFLYNLIDDIHGRQPVINEGADWHMSGTHSLQYVESSALCKAEVEQNLYSCKRMGILLKNIYSTELYETIGYIIWQKFYGQSVRFSNKQKKNKRVQK